MATSESLVSPSVFSVLNGASSVTSIVTGIFDLNNIPEGQVLPYIVLGEMTEVPENTFGKDGQDMTLAIHIWSDYSGKEEVEAIHNAIHTVLDGPETLTLAGYKCVACLYDSGNTITDNSDGKKLHRVDRYRIQTQQL
jgi:hypothetical protein